MARLHPRSVDRVTPIAQQAQNSDIQEMVAWMLCGVVLILWGLRIWGYGTIMPLTAIPAVTLVAWGLFLLIWHGASHPTHNSMRLIFGVTLLLTVIALATWSYTQVLTVPAYGTDEMAFDQYAAHLWLHGINPYGRSLAAAFTRYQVSPNGYTWTLTGKPVTLLSYPALAFEVYIPFMLLGWHTQIAVGLNVIAWISTLIILFLTVPRSIKPVTIILASLSVYISYAVGGVTDALFVPFLVLSAVGWDNYPKRTGWSALWSPLWFGMAMGIKQTPWVVLPFLLMGIAYESKRIKGTWRDGFKSAFRYAMITGIVFIAPNIPFLLKNPISLLKGILTPLIASTVPSGQGLITLSLFLPTGGGSLFAYTILSFLILAGLLIAYWITYPRLKGWTFLLPSLALFFATRSFGSYLVMLVPAGLVALVTTTTLKAPPWTKHTKITLGSLGVLTIAAIMGALGIPSPLSMALVGVHTTGQLATVDQVKVSVANQTNRAVHPHFTANIGGSLTAFWNRLAGPAQLGPHTRAVYTLAAPNFYGQPPLTGGFQMVAFTAHTKTLSHTKAYVPTTWHIALTPASVNRPVSYGAPIQFTAQILNQFDRPVAASGIPVYLGQIIYAQRGLKYGEALINSGYAGETPATAITNNKGVATFTVRDSHHESNPTYFEANLVNDQNFYPYGYSQIVPVRFGTP